MGSRILFVDDDPILRSVAEIALRRAGHDVQTFATADAALQAVRSAESAYDLAVLDIRLGAGSDGFALALQLTALRPALRIVMVSGAVDELHRERARAMGLAGVFSKTHALASLELLVAPTAGL